MTTPKQGRILLLASYPKSGNTWVRALLSALEAEGRDLDLHALEGEMVTSLHPRICPFPFNLLNQEEQDLWHADACRASVSPTCPLTLLKTHLALRPDLTGRSLFPPEVVRGAIHIVRHPFDVVPSLANHIGGSLEDAISLLLESHATPGGDYGRSIPEHWGSWAEHTRSWLDGREPFPVLRIRYEDLKRSPSSTLRTIAAFAGRGEIGDETLEKAIEASSFDRLRSQEVRRGFPERPSDSRRFFRSGRLGEGWEVLDTSQRERILSHCRPEMSRLGYSSEAPTP